MKFQEYTIDGENCVIRSLSKILNKDHIDVKKDLISIRDELNCSNYNDVEVFETYMQKNDIIEIYNNFEDKIENLKLEKGKYIVFCWDNKDFYHMTTIIDNVIYDKNNKVLDLYVIKIYRESI